MATTKITLNELRSIVKQIIKENNEFRDMDSSDIAAEEYDKIIGIYEEQLSELFNFNSLKNAYGEFVGKMKKESSALSEAIYGKFSERDRPYLMGALSSKFQYVPSTDDFPKDKYIKYIVDKAIIENLDAKYTPSEDYKYAVISKYVIGFEGREDRKYFRTKEAAKAYVADKPKMREYIGVEVNEKRTETLAEKIAKQLKSR